MSKFEKLYMRPNLDNQGTVPATDPLCWSPDIWVAGDTPISNYEKVLSSEKSYAVHTGKSLVYNKDNYIYVRGKNGSEILATNNVTLYWAEASVIQWPSKWQQNKIGTDQGPNDKGSISNIKPNKIGVADRPFFWPSVRQPSDSHYCLIAQFNDDHNSNPFPKVDTCLDMAKLVQKNLQWGWRNVTVCDNHENVVFSYQASLNVDATISEKEKSYLLYLKPNADLVGYQVSFQCSQNDANGKKIEMKKTKVEQGGQILGCECVLKRGFTSTISAYLYNDNGTPMPYGASFPFIARALVSVADLEAGNALDLQDRKFNSLISEQMKLSAFDNDSEAYVLLGGYSGIIK